MAGLPFTPKFDPTTIFKGQRIHAVTGQTTMGGGMGGMMTGTINASEIDLLKCSRLGKPVVDSDHPLASVIFKNGSPHQELRS